MSISNKNNSILSDKYFVETRKVDQLKGMAQIVHMQAIILHNYNKNIITVQKIKTKKLKIELNQEGKLP